MPVSYENYKGNPIIVLKKDEDDPYPFKFGVAKGKLILEYYNQILEFVEKNNNKEV